MTEFVAFLAGALLGGLVTALWISARNRWAKAWATLGAPDKAKSEGRAKIKEAKGKAAKARYELMRLVFFLLLFILVLGIALVFMTMTLI